MSRFHIALLNPEIPGNTGNIGRLSLGVGATLHLIHPLGFSTDEKAARRAGIDHWSKVDLVEHLDEEAFWRWADGRRVFALSAKGGAPFNTASFREGDVLLFGRESRGLPDRITERLPLLTIPSPGPVRSLNLSNAVAVVAYETRRQLSPELFEAPGEPS